MIVINITRLRHAWPENAGFEITHEKNRNDYIFIHFHTPVTLTLNGITTRLHPHACVIFHKDTGLHFKAEENLIHDWMHFEGDIPEFLAKYSLECDKIYYPGAYDYITDAIRSIETEHFSRKSHYKDIQLGRLGELFIKLARNTVLDESGEMIPVGIKQSFIELRNEVFASLSKDWTISELAKKINLSQSRFYVLYKEIFGIGPKSDLCCARIELAKNLLRRGIYSVEQVGEMSGYKNNFNFIRMFRKATGMTPGEYKKHNS